MTIGTSACDLVRQQSIELALYDAVALTHALLELGPIDYCDMATAVVDKSGVLRGQRPMRVQIAGRYSGRGGSTGLSSAQRADMWCRWKAGYCRIANVVDAGLAKRQTASVYLKSLTEIGVLREISTGRESLFVHPKYVELLTGEENVWVFYAGIETDNALEAETREAAP